MTGSQVAQQIDVSPDAAVVLKVYEAFSAKDIPSLLELLDPSVTISQSSRLPWGGEYQGHAGVLDFLGRLTSALDTDVATDRIIDDQAGHVVASGVTQGRVVATGVPFTILEAHVWTVRDGKVTRFEPYVDTATMRAAIGLTD